MLIASKWREPEPLIQTGINKQGSIAVGARECRILGLGNDADRTSETERCDPLPFLGSELATADRQQAVAFRQAAAEEGLEQEAEILVARARAHVEQVRASFSPRPFTPGTDRRGENP